MPPTDVIILLDGSRSFVPFEPIDKHRSFLKQLVQGLKIGPSETQVRNVVKFVLYKLVFTNSGLL